MFFEAVVRNWWMFLIRGGLAILFGFVAWAWPELTVTALVILFGAYALVDGVLAIIAAITAGGEGRWLPLLLAGIAGIVIGIVTFVWPDITALALLFIIAAWAIVLGILQVVAAVQLRNVMEGEWALGLAGIASVVFGVIIALFPGEGAIAVVWALGAFAILFGMLLIALAFQLRALHQGMQQRQNPSNQTIR